MTCEKGETSELNDGLRSEVFGTSTLLSLLVALFPPVSLESGIDNCCRSVREECGSGEKQTQELIVFLGEIQAGSVAGEARDDAAMLLAEPGRFKGLTKLLPSRGCVGGQMRAL